MNRFPTKAIDYTTDIDISIYITKMIDIKEANSEITIRFSVLLKWRDPRLKFDYLKTKTENNVLSEKIWIPSFRFGNLKDLKQKYPGAVWVLREGQMKENSRTELTMKQMYEGSENSLTMKDTYQITFVCSFDNIIHYPFDKEFCTIDLINARAGYKFMKFNPKKVKYYGKRLVDQYTVENISIHVERFVQGLNGVKVSIKLGRDLQSIFCVTYLPTIIMNIINQATVYLDNNQFLEAIIMVNITCLMVLSALYISVSNNLPATAEIKYIDIWLLYSLIFPFIIILFNIILFITTTHNHDERSRIKLMARMKSKEKTVKQLFKGAEIISRVITVFINPIFYVVFSCAYFSYGVLHL